MHPGPRPWGILLTVLGNIPRFVLFPAVIFCGEKYFLHGSPVGGILCHAWNPCTELYSEQGIHVRNFILIRESMRWTLFRSGNPCAQLFSDQGIHVQNFILIKESVCRTLFRSGNPRAELYSDQGIHAHKLIPNRESFRRTLLWSGNPCAELCPDLVSLSLKKSSSRTALFYSKINIIGISCSPNVLDGAKKFHCLGYRYWC